ncbi:hypothetical protein BJ546DRAFT_1058167 [Cryomyces antarcticus]
MLSSTYLPLLILLPALAAAANATYLTATAIVTNGQNHSALECWEFSTPLAVSSDAGTRGVSVFNFAGVTSAVYTVIPPRFNGGTHDAPRPQIVLFLSGLAHITLPERTSLNASHDEAWILGGADALVLALDVVGTGHVTTYPSDEPTVSVQLPFAGSGRVPAHRVLGAGPCAGEGQVVGG